LSNSCLVDSLSRKLLMVSTLFVDDERAQVETERGRFDRITYFDGITKEEEGRHIVMNITNGNRGKSIFISWLTA